MPHSPYQPYYSPQDFQSQTWLAAIGETISMQALASGVTVLLGVVVIAHPLVLAGADAAAATAAAMAVVGATAIWAVGLLGDIDEGYAIQPSEDFTALFWSDAPSLQLQIGAEATGSGLVDDLCSSDGDNGRNNRGGFGKDATAAKIDEIGDCPAAFATVGGSEIIEQDQERLRRVFLQKRERSVEKQLISRKPKESGDDEAVSKTPSGVVGIQERDQTRHPLRSAEQQSMRRQPTEKKEEKRNGEQEED